ncbi:unnamed protein product [Closterium sp. NIES-53]
MVDVVEPTVLLAPEAGEDFQAVAAAGQANPMAVVLDSGCSHHLMGTKAVFVDMTPSDGVKHGVQANLLSASQLKESGVQLQGDGDEMLLVAATGEVLGRAHGRVLCTNLLPCLTHSQSTEGVALRTIIPAMKSTLDRLHARLAHVSVDMIKCSEKHEVATGLNTNPSTGTDPPCVSCIGAKLVRHTFPDKGSNAEEALVAKKSDVLWEFQKWLVLVERQPKKPVLMLRSDRGGEFLRKEFTDFVEGKGIVHDLTCPYTPQQNGMAEQEMRTAVESMRTMLLHMDVQHHWWHLALQQAVRVRNCLERSTTPPGTTPYQLLTGKKPDLTLVRVWGCMVQFMVPEHQRGGNVVPKARWGLHLGVSPKSKVGSLQFAVTTTRSDITFAWSNSGSGLTVRSDQHWREVDRYPAYHADTHDTAWEFGGGPKSLELIDYVDADDAGD